MKHWLGAMVFAVAGSVGSGVQASETVTLLFNADIVPSACSVSLATPAGATHVDYGAIDLSAQMTAGRTANLTLMEQSVVLTVNCDAATRVGITATDGRAGSAPQGFDAMIGQNYVGINPVTGGAFGLGTAGTSPIGGYFIHLAPQPGSVTMGSQQAGALRSDNGGTSWSAIHSTQNHADRVQLASGSRIHTWTTLSNQGVLGKAPAALTSATMRYEIFPVILPESRLPLTGAIILDGHATFTLVYL
ncbi:DUF1120 domain-containing protein [Cupriavidus sp. BIS7]|uniref:DUF1120 domain-containing protein n=1 Tax=Cupriavidus sp. BIS7 TaxID=1217718 RepID=UPI0002E98C9D|nr:DUF1120 domain-containing protein [Cupriavidus sp. BIS7]